MGREFKENQQRYLPAGMGRVIYAGGDDFLGVLYDLIHKCFQSFALIGQHL
jgi:hypothetical protein